MAWSEYSRFVGDVFGAPLAMEGLLAFFVESTFLGLWIFGWNRLPKRLHLATLVARRHRQLDLGASSSSSRTRGCSTPSASSSSTAARCMVDIWAVLTNNTALAAYSHTIFGAIAVGRRLPARHRLVPPLAAPPRRHRHRGCRRSRRRRRGTPTSRAATARTTPSGSASLRIGAVVAIVGFGGVALTGDLQAKLMFEQQPMKMAAAEAACDDGTGFSVLAIGDLGAPRLRATSSTIIEVPGLLVVPRPRRLRRPTVRASTRLVPSTRQVRHDPDDRLRRRGHDQLRADHGGDLLGLPPDDRASAPSPRSPRSWPSG